MSSLETPNGRLELVAFSSFFFVFPSIILLLLLLSLFRIPPSVLRFLFVPCNLWLRARRLLSATISRLSKKDSRFSGGGGEAGSSVGLGELGGGCVDGRKGCGCSACCVQEDWSD